MYCQARLRAAEYNEAFATRASAAECLPGVTEESLKKYELDLVKPPNDVIALMADAYNAPELRIWYCGNECPLGKQLKGVCAANSQHAFIRLVNALGEANTILMSLAKVMDDGVLSGAGEIKQIEEIEKKLLEIYRRTNENLLMIEKAKKSGQF